MTAVHSRRNVGAIQKSASKVVVWALTESNLLSVKERLSQQHSSLKSALDILLSRINPRRHEAQVCLSEEPEVSERGLPPPDDLTMGEGEGGALATIEVSVIYMHSFIYLLMIIALL